MYISQEGGTTKTVSMKNESDLTSVLTKYSKRMDYSGNGNTFDFPADIQRYFSNGGENEGNKKSWFIESDTRDSKNIGLICIKKDSTYDEAMVKLSGCTSTKQLGNRTICSEFSEI